jgi:hypothetical protein
MRLARWGPFAVLDVAGQCPGEGVAVGVVGVVDDELGDREEVALDRVEVAGVGWGGHQLDVVVGGVGADVRGPVGAQAVLDPGDPPPGRDRGADLGHELKVVAPAPPRSPAPAQAVVVDVVGAEHLAGAERAVVGRLLTLGPTAGRPAGAAIGLRLIRSDRSDRRPPRGRRRPAPRPSGRGSARPWARSRGRDWPSMCESPGTTAPPRPARGRGARD